MIPPERAEPQLEREEDSRYGGIAFGRTGTTWDHMLNIQAGRITFGRERPEDFLEWANDGADRSSWPLRWKYHVFSVSCVVPRRIYGQYLKERLQRFAGEASPTVTLTELSGEAIDIDTGADGYVVKYVEAGPDGRTRPLHCDFVVFATGHLEPVYKPFFHRIQDSERFMTDPYAAGARAVFASIDPQETVLIAGSALSAFDTVVSLVNAGHRGKIVIASRGGHLHGTYPADHQHDIWTVRRPPFLDAETLTPDDVVAGVKAEYAYLRDTFGVDGDEQVFAERVMKAWEPYVIELTARLNDAEVRTLLDRYKSFIVTNRTSTVPEIGNVVRNRMRGFNGAPATITVVAAEIDDMRPIADGTQIRVSFSDHDDLVVDRVVNCLGNDTVYDHVRRPLWSRIVQRRRLAQPHRKTHRGIEVGEHGELVAPDGTVAERLFCVGPTRQGDETTRRGRLGAFVFSIGTLRNQCFDTATELLRRVRHAGDEDYRALPEQLHHRLDDSVDWIVGHLRRDSEHIDAALVRKHLRSHAEQVLLPITREYLTARSQSEVSKHRGAVAAATEAFADGLVQDLHLDPSDASRAASLIAALVERHVVHAMCDTPRSPSGARPMPSRCGRPPTCPQWKVWHDRRGTDVTVRQALPRPPRRVDLQLCTPHRRHARRAADPSRKVPGRQGRARPARIQLRPHLRVAAVPSRRDGRDHLRNGGHRGPHRRSRRPADGT